MNSNAFTELSIEIDEDQEDHFDVAVFDLDNTLAESVWPDRHRIGDPIPAGVSLLDKYAARGYTIVIDSARRKIDEPMVWEWVKEHNLPVDGVRCGKKLKARVYIDDRAQRFIRPLEGGGA